MPLLLLWQDKRPFCKTEVGDALHHQWIHSFFMLFHNRKPECPSQGFAAKQKGCVVWHSLRARLSQWDRERIFSICLCRRPLDGTANTWEDRLRSLNWLEWAWNKMIISYEHAICAMYPLHKFNTENGQTWKLDSTRNTCLCHAVGKTNDRQTMTLKQTLPWTTEICFTCRHWCISKSTAASLGTTLL